MTADPTVENMAYFAVETAKMARHMLGKSVRVAMLSASTDGFRSGTGCGPYPRRHGPGPERRGKGSLDNENHRGR